MFKRFISILLIIVTLLTTVMSLGGCSTQNNTSLSIGQWLTMVDEAFGMQSYTSEEPYFLNVKSDNPYFAAVQIAAEWDVIDKNKSIDVNEPSHLRIVISGLEVIQSGLLETWSTSQRFLELFSRLICRRFLSN